VVRRSSRATEPPSSPHAPPAAHQQIAAAIPTQGKPVDALRPKTAVAAEVDDSKAVVRSPMVGTFYRAPSPKDPPFVEIGSIVRMGDPLCVIEVMKLFTTISADREGKIASIFPGNAELVEFDQPLFEIELV
jgi:acetyl-CoA carboxylase biotin carboxyl carrier protein